MELMKKFGLWIVAIVVALAAAGFYMVVVRADTSQTAVRMAALTARHDELDKESERNVFPTRKWINAQKKANEVTKLQVGDVINYLIGQPRYCHTRIFFEEPSGELRGVGQQINLKTQRIKWIMVYKQHVDELYAQLDDSGLRQWSLEVFDPGTGVPTAEQIQEAQEKFWFQKDLADILTNRVVEDLERIMKFSPDGRDKFPRRPSDLVIDFSVKAEKEEQRLDSLLRGVKTETLRSVLEAILINDGDADLATIFDTYVPEDFNWNRVLEMTMNDEQRRYLDRLVPPPGQDIANHRRFRDFVTELRSVRYRSDVIELLERQADKLAEEDEEDAKEFRGLADSVKKLSDIERARIRERLESPDWGRSKLAAAIAAVVSIANEEEYKVVCDNHKIRIDGMSNVDITWPGSLTGSGRAREGRRYEEAPAAAGAGGRSRAREGKKEAVRTGSKIYRATDFKFQVTIEFEQLPVFLRRLQSNSWQYRVDVMSIIPVTSRGGRIDRESDLTRDRGADLRPGGAERPDRARPRRPGALPRPRRPGIELAEPKPGEDAGEDLRNFVTVGLQCRAYQFTPLLEKHREEEKAKRAAKDRRANRTKSKR